MKRPKMLLVICIVLAAILGCNFLTSADQELLPIDEPTAVPEVPTLPPVTPTEPPYIFQILLLGHDAPALGDAAYTIQTDGGFIVHVNKVVPEADLVLFTVHALDGPMPGFLEGLDSLAGQSLPHAAILLTQTELLNDPELLQLELLEINEILDRYADPAQVDQLKVLEFSDPELIAKIEALLAQPPMDMEMHARDQ
jgi:hypothetical protein